nr:GATA transcription factor 19-like [Ipomoea batatas]
MRRCSSGCHGNMVGTCSCGLFHRHGQNSDGSSTAFSMFFSSAPINHRPGINGYDYEDAQNMYSFASSSSASVDCTLSLGTPSTRLTTENEKRGADHHHRKSGFCWDIFQSNKQPPPSSAGNKSGRGGAAPDVARRCANCDTTSTPLWRNGPRGPKSLCNACGIRYKKEERRASAAAATANGGAPVMDSQFINNSWVNHHHYSQTPQKLSCYPPPYANEFRFIEEDDRDSDAGAGISFLSWRLNVADRPSLVHDFTR